MFVVLRTNTTTRERRARLEAAEAAGKQFSGHPAVHVAVFGPFDSVDAANTWIDSDPEELGDGYVSVQPVDQSSPLPEHRKRLPLPDSVVSFWMSDGVRPLALHLRFQAQHPARLRRRPAH